MTALCKVFPSVACRHVLRSSMALSPRLNVLPSESSSNSFDRACAEISTGGYSASSAAGTRHYWAEWHNNRSVRTASCCNSFSLQTNYSWRFRSMPIACRLPQPLCSKKSGHPRRPRPLPRLLPQKFTWHPAPIAVAPAYRGWIVVCDRVVAMQVCPAPLRLARLGSRQKVNENTGETTKADSASRELQAIG